MIKKISTSLIGLSATLCAYASQYNEPMPWEGPLEKIMHSITGPVAMTLGVIVIVLAGLGIAFGESGSGVRKILMVVCGLAIAFTASSIVVTLFNPSGGVTYS